VSDLVRTLVVCGLLSGTQPVTIMGMLLVMSGEEGARNGWAFVFGAFLGESAFLIGASLVLGSTVTPSSSPALVFIYLRIAVGVVLVVAGLRLRRPPRKPEPEVPRALARLQQLSPFKSFIAGLALADYQGPVLGSLAIAASTTTLRGQLLSIALYTLLATGIPVAILVATTRSETAHEKMSSGTAWVMLHRRRLASWIAIVIGTFVAAEGLLARLAV